MKLKKWLKLVDPIGDIVIWTNEDIDEEEPTFEGSILDVPWWLVECEIGRPKGEDEEPIFISNHTNKFGTTLPVIVVNVLV